MVTARIKRLAPAVVTVSLTDSKTGQVETLTCTPEHPFFTVGGGWVEAGSLGIGSLIVSRAGPALSVTNVTWQRNQGSEKAGGTGSTLGGYVVYNLTVEDDHTFFVGNAGGGTWVHNARGCNPQQEASAIRKIYNSISKNAKFGPDGEVEGAIKELNGIPTGYDHVTELNNAMRSMENGAEMLRNSPSAAAQAARNAALTHLDKIWDALGKGLYP